MSYARAGRYGPEPLLDSTGALLTNTSVLVKDSGGATATLYTSRTKSVTASNPTTSSSIGNLQFFADPGEYTITVTVGAVAQTPIEITVPIDPAEAAQDIEDVPFTVALTSDGVALIVKGASGQTSDLTRWEDSTSAIVAKVTAGGAATFTTASTASAAIALQINATDGTLMAKLQRFSTENTGQLVLARGGTGSTNWVGGRASTHTLQVTTDVGFIITGATAQTADLQRWVNIGGAYLAVDKDSNLVPQSNNNLSIGTASLQFSSVNATNLIASGLRIASGQTNWISASAGIAGVDLAIGGVVVVGATAVTNAQFASLAGSATKIPIVAKAAGSQTADRQQWQDSSANVDLAVSPGGRLYTRDYVGVATPESLRFGALLGFTARDTLTDDTGATGVHVVIQPSASASSIKGVAAGINALAIVNPNNGVTLSNVTGHAEGTYGLLGSGRNAGAGTVAQATGVWADVRSTSSGTITDGRAVFAGSPQGTITTAYGVYIDSQSAGVTNPFALYQPTTTDVNVLAGPVKPKTTGTVGLTVTALGSQTSDLQQWRTSTPTTVSAILPGGVLISDDATKGIILKDAAGTPHYWRVTVSAGGVLTTTDLGTTRPTS